MKRYGLWGEISRDFLTHGGKVIVHDSAAELEFLVPGTPVREVPPSVPVELTIPIRFHPDMAAVRWPLDRRDFVRRGGR